MRKNAKAAFNNVQGATELHAVQIVAGVEPQGLNPASVRKLADTLTRKQKQKLRQHPKYPVYKTA